jgi:hydrogenase maturation protein HypF
VGLCEAVSFLSRAHDAETVVLSGGVFQNEMLLGDIRELLRATGLNIWTNHVVPANDGGISLGQAALAAMSNGGSNAFATDRIAARPAALVEKIFSEGH